MDIKLLADIDSKRRKEMSLKLMYITNNSDIALIAEKYGVDRIWVDLETLGKAERQKNMDTVKSNHRISDISKIKPLLTRSEMLVRVNPINDNSKQEIDAVVDAGADIIMLPMWKNPKEVEKFLNIVNGRAKTTLLLETKEAVACVDDVLNMGGADEIHIGLNDLHLSYKLTFMFELLSNGVVESLCNKIEKFGIPYGFGGIAKIGDGLLPAEKIIMEHYRLGSTRAILSRTFCDNARIDDLSEIDRVFNINMKKILEFQDSLQCLPMQSFEKNKIEVAEIVSQIVRNKEECRYDSK